MSSVTITTNVKLNASSTGLDVDDHGSAIKVPQEVDASNLVWQLTGNAARGSFNAMNAANPGFQWMEPCPPAGIFGTPTLAANGNQITLTDANNSASTAGGPWVYKLWATVGGTQYSTTASTSATTNNPAIKNN